MLPKLDYLSLIPRTHMVDREIRHLKLFLWSSHKVPGHLCTHTCIHTHEMRIFFNKSDGGDTIGKAPDRGDFPRLARSFCGGRSLFCCHSVQEVERVQRKVSELQVLWFPSNFPISSKTGKHHHLLLENPRLCSFRL